MKEICLFHVKVSACFYNDEAESMVMAGKKLVHLTGSSLVCHLCIDFGTMCLWQKQPPLPISISNWEQVKGKSLHD